MKALDGGVYEARWGVVAAPFITGQGVAVGGFFAAIVDPDLPAADRARLSKPLRAAPRSHPTSITGFAVGVAAVMAVLVAAVVVNPGTFLLVVAVAVVVGALARHVALWVWRRAAVIPEESRDRVIVAGVKPRVRDLGDARCRHPVVDAAMGLGEIENTSGVDEAAVDAQWRSAWARLAPRDEWRAGPVSWVEPEAGPRT